MTTTIDAAEVLPRWDLESIFPGPESPELRAALDGITRDTARLEAIFDRRGVGSGAKDVGDADLVEAFEEVVNEYNRLLDDAGRIHGYLFCLVAADVRDEAAQQVAGEWRQLKSGLARLAPRFTAWTGSLDIDAIAARSDLARDHAPALRRIQIAAAHQMDPGQEELAAALGPSGASAWMALRDEVAGGATTMFELDGEEREWALSEIDNLLYHEDRDVRRRSYFAEQSAWRPLTAPLAAALNGVKGEQVTLAERRGWGEPLNEALFASAIDRPILDAMLQAINEALPDYQHYLGTKARFLGLPRLAGYDIVAPVGEQSPWPFEIARDFIIEQFAAASPRLGALAARAFAERWIDAGPRPGKDGGAFSYPVGDDESRIFLNYLPVYDWMNTLAHELGHSYHTAVVVEAGRTMLQAPADVSAPTVFPMTLAETASTFCEVLVQRQVRGQVTAAQEVALLDGWLQSFSLNVFGILPYYLFERDVFAIRRQRELAVAEIEALMVSARRRVTGEAIDPETLYATSWIAPHFFMDNLSFYNFPYAFGMLFSVGLATVRERDPEGFFTRFDSLLADSGMRDAVDLAAPFGIDLRDPAFWRTSLDVFRADLERYAALADEVAASA
jgi:pepF/M3 family oligoendopeptidase